MKILLTNLTLASRTGTEIVTRDLALGLARAGHHVCVFSPLLGTLADEIAASGIPVVSRLDEVPFCPDIIHGHHHVETTLALVHFQNVPAVFVCHDRLSWYDSPPRLDAIRRYVAVDWNCRERLVMEAGIPEERTRVILNAVDLRRFPRRGPLPERPSKALIFSNYATENPELEIIRQACADAGLEVAVVGQGVGAQSSRPEEMLGSYDLVLAKGRCALEALASGCSVILCDWQGLGPMVTREEVEQLRKWNFGMRCLQTRLTAEAIQRQLARYLSADAAGVTDFIRGHASLDDAIARYVSLYQEAIRDSSTVCVSVAEATESLARRVGSLESLLRSNGEPFAMPPLPPQAAGNIGLRLPERFGRMAAGSAAQVRVEIENRSAEWLASMAPHPVHLSYHWLDSRTRRCVVFEGERSPLTAAVRPRSRHSQEVRILAPHKPGSYLLVLTLVQEGRMWFDRMLEPVAAKWEVNVEADSKRPGEKTLRDVTEWTSVKVLRDGKFHNLAFLSDPKDGMLTFVESQRFVAAALACPQTSCVLTTPELAHGFPDHIALATAADPKRCFFEIHNWLATRTSFYGADSESAVDPDARLHPRSWVDEKNVVIGPDVVVGPNASVLGRAVLGEKTVLHAGVVIGSAGFQTSDRCGDAIELTHAGATDIAPDCHIFANAVIARGLFRQSTRIGRGCRIGNGAFISHNCVLAEGVFVGHGAALNGNVRVAENAWIGPGATIVNGITIGEAAQVSLGATVIRDVPPGKRVTGSLAMGHRKMLRLMAAAHDAR